MMTDRPLLWATVTIGSSEAAALAGLPAIEGDAFHARRMLGRALAMRLLAESGEGAWTIATDARGKPVAVGPSVRHLSIAHSGATVVATVTSLGPVGIDLERHDRVRDYGGLADAAFGPSERSAVAMHGARIFYRIWTMREAIGKATGDGLGLAVDRTDRTPPMIADGVWMRVGDGWLMIHDFIAADLGMALAVRDSDGNSTAQLAGRSLASLRVDVGALLRRVS